MNFLGCKDGLRRFSLHAHSSLIRASLLFRILHALFIFEVNYPPVNVYITMEIPGSLPVGQDLHVWHMFHLYVSLLEGTTCLVRILS